LAKPYARFGGLALAFSPLVKKTTLKASDRFRKSREKIGYSSITDVMAPEA
jgi:hypothetical protein